MTYLTSTSLGAPQIFPFSSLRSYFDHQTRNGPGGEKQAVDPELSTVINTPLSRHLSEVGGSAVKTVSVQSPPKHTSDQRPTNNKPETSPSFEPPSASAAASPVVKYHPAIPEQVLKATDQVPHIFYGQITEKSKTNSNYQIPQFAAGIVPHVPLSVVGEKKYKFLGGNIPLLPPQVILSPPTTYQQKNTDSYLTTVPSQDLQTPMVSLKRPEEYVNQNTQDNPQITVSPVKVTKAQNHLYPKKWQPETEKDDIKKKIPKSDASNLSKLNKVKASSLPKTEVKKHQSIPTQLEAASSLQKPDLSLFPVKAKTKFPGLDEQVDRDRLQPPNSTARSTQITCFANARLMPSTLHSKAPLVAHTDSKALHANPITKNPSNETASNKFQVFS
jgi:hypothetical protein